MPDNVLQPFKPYLAPLKLNNLDLAAWLKDTLTKLPAWPNSRIDELLPLTPEFIESL